MTAQPSIVNALAAVMNEVGAIGKNRRNDQQGFNFRGIDDVLNALHAPLAKAGVVIAPEVQERISEVRETSNKRLINVVHLRVRFTAYGPAGDSLVLAETWGEAQDSGDKATNKAMSAAYKYAMFQAFAIPTGEEDADQTTVEAAPPRLVEDPAKAVKWQITEAAQKLGLTTPQQIKDDYQANVGGDISQAGVDELNKYLDQLNERAETAA